MPSLRSFRSWLRWPKASLRVYFMVVIGLATVPVTILAASLITQQVQMRKSQLELDLSRAAASFALTIEREVASSMDALYILSLSEPLQHGDVAGLFSSISAAPWPRQSWRSAFLVNLDGDVIFNTRQPQDRQLGKVGDMAALARLKQTRQAVITDLVAGPDGEPSTGIMVPVLVKGQLTGALGAWIPPSSWHQLIMTMAPARDGFMSIFDAHMHLVARNKDLLEGGQAYGAWHMVSATGWGVEVGEPAPPIDHAHLMSIAATLAMGLLSLITGMYLAMRVARQVTVPLQMLTKHGPHALDKPSTVRELNQLEQALTDAEVQREAAHERLQAKADEFEILFQWSPIGLAITQTSSCDRVLRNPALARMLNELVQDSTTPSKPRTGWPQHQVRSQGKTIPVHNLPLQKAARTGQQQMDVELEVIHDTGRTVKLIAHAMPLLDAQGQVRGAIAAFTDITERKQAEELLITAERHLRESQHLMELAQAAGHVGFFNHDFQRGTVTWTSGLSRLFGITLSNFEGPWKAWMRRLDRADRKQVRRTIQMAIAEHANRSTFEFGIHREDGSLHWLSTKVMIGYAVNGAPLHMRGAVVDITQQKSYEQERAARVERETQARHEAENTNRAKDEFLAMLGHELRNPLGAMAAACEVLNRAQDQEEMAQRARQIISRQTTHLGRLMDDLLDVARVISSKILLVREPFRLDQLAQHVCHTFDIAGQLQAHQLDTHFDEVWVHADMTRIEQVITNLLDNARKYTQEQGHISMRVERNGVQAVLSIQDSGMGMTPEMMDRAFDLFAQGERSLDRRQGGLGIGLTLVKRLVELHGGQVSVSSPGLQQGCTFTLHLPLANAVPAPAAKINHLMPSASHRKVVVIEDNDDAREALCAMLALGEHDILSAVDGRAGLDLIARELPDLALIDIGLPELTGYEVARQIREQGYQGWLIALSGYGQADDLQRSRMAGFDDHLVKPVTPEKLAHLLAYTSEPRSSMHR